MKKILMVVNPMVSGIEYHRQLIPHYYLNEQEGYEVSQINEIDTASDEFLKQFDLVQFSRNVSFKGEHKQVLERLRSLDIRSIVDIDDYWILPHNHPNYYDFRKHKVPQQAVECMKYADLVTCPTGFLAAVIQSVNPDVEVLPNAINPDQPQFRSECHASEKVRFGWVGGSSHLEDIKLLAPGLNKLNCNPHIRDKYQLYLMGFSPDDKSGIYNQLEQIFICGLQENPDIYYRINGTNPYSYASGYNLFDVALVPLAHSLFNNCKSELKMIEAGFMRKAVIVSDVMPYSTLITDENCISVDPLRNYTDWYKAMMLLIREPALVHDLAEQLYETVKVKHHIATVNETRMQVYENLINRGTAS